MKLLRSQSYTSSGYFSSPSTSVTSSPSVDRPSPLGERVSGDGAESPDDPIREVFKYAKLHAEITSVSLRSFCFHIAKFSHLTGESVTQFNPKYP